MALKRGENTKTISVATKYANTGNPKVIPENAFAAIEKESRKGREDLLKLMKVKHESAWVTNFSNKSLDFYTALDKKYKNNPKAYELEAEAYNKQVIAKTPLAYKKAAFQSLFTYKANGVKTAYNNWYEIDKDNRISDYNKYTNLDLAKKDNDFEGVSFSNESVINKTNDLIKMFINEHQDRSNTHFGSWGENLVASGDYDGVTFNKEYNNHLIADTTSFLYHLAVSQLDSDNNFADAFNLIDLFKTGKIDTFVKELGFDSKEPFAKQLDKRSATLKRTIELINNPEHMLKIAKDAEKRLEEYMGQTRAAWQSDSKSYLNADIKAWKDGSQIGVGTHWSSIISRDNSILVDDEIRNFFGEIKQQDHTAIAELMHKKINLYKHVIKPILDMKVSSAVASEYNNADKKMVLDGYMAAIGINDDNIGMKWDSSDMTKLFKLSGELGILPDAVITYFDSDRSSFTNPNNVKMFRKKVQDYKYMVSINERVLKHSGGENFDLMEKAINENWLLKDDDTLALLLKDEYAAKTEGKDLNNLKTKLEAHSTHINVQFNRNDANWNNYLTEVLEEISDDRWFGSKAFWNLIDLGNWGETKNKPVGSVTTWTELTETKGADTLFKSNWTWFPSNWTSMDLSPDVKNNLKLFAKDYLLKHLPPGVNPFKEDGSPTIYLTNALNYALVMNKKQGYGYSKVNYNFKNQGKIDERNNKIKSNKNYLTSLRQKLKYAEKGSFFSIEDAGQDTNWILAQIKKTENTNERLKEEVEWYKDNRNTDYVRFPIEDYHPNNVKNLNLGGIDVKIWFDSLSDTDRKAFLGVDENGDPHSFEKTFAAIRFNNNMVFEAIDGQFEKDGTTPKFSLSVINLNGELHQVTGDGESWSPFSSQDVKIPVNFHTDKTLPATMENVALKISEENFYQVEEWFNNTLGINLNNDDKRWLKEVMMKWDQWRVLHSGDEFGIDTMFRTVNDTKIPYHIKIDQILNVLGYDVNIDDHLESLAKLEKNFNDNKTLEDKLNEVNTMSLNASIESLFPPNEMNLSNYKDGMQFEYFAKKNLDNSALPYVLRSNNPLGVHIMGGDKKWDGELDIQATAKDGGSVLATFNHPANGVRAAVILMMNKSDITFGINDIEKLYGSTPSLEDIIKGHTAAESVEGYLLSLEKNFGISRDTNIDFFNPDQMISLLVAMSKHEIGIQDYNKYWGDNGAMLHYYIKQGYELALEKHKQNQ